MFDTLVQKTIILLSVQLLITWAGAQAVITYFRVCHWSGVGNVDANRCEDGALDLFPTGSLVPMFYMGNVIANVVVGLILIAFFQRSADTGIGLFCVWSLTFGFTFGFIFIYINENVAEKALALTASITLLCALVGLSVHVDLFFMAPWLFSCLVLFLLIGIGRGVIYLPNAALRLKAVAGSLLFGLYLIGDFNALAQASSPEQNNWDNALSHSIHLYLDVINLLLEILEALDSDTSQ